jgi:glycerol-3-phosphate dehydrogenase (NAD(P)+)
VELGGALKNVIAVAAGMCDGMGLGHNTKAALVARGVMELARLGCALGGDRTTFFGLAGLGDLMVTCYAPQSRNRTFGERVGRGERPAEVMASMAQIAEGVKSAAPVRALGHDHGVDMPICEEVYRVLHEDKEPRESLSSLMLRGRRDEAEAIL